MSRAGEEKARAGAKAFLERLGMTPKVKDYPQCLDDATHMMLSRARRQEHHASREKTILSGVGALTDYNEFADRLYGALSAVATEHNMLNMLTGPEDAAGWMRLASDIRVLVRQYNSSAKGGRKRQTFDHEQVCELEAELLRKGIKDPGERSRKIRLKFKMGESTLRNILKRDSKT